MSRAQLLFALALTGVTTLVLVVAAYVASSTVWGRRWYRKRDRAPTPPRTGEDQP